MKVCRVLDWFHLCFMEIILSVISLLGDVILTAYFGYFHQLYKENIGSTKRYAKRYIGLNMVLCANFKKVDALQALQVYFISKSLTIFNIPCNACNASIIMLF